MRYRLPTAVFVLLVVLDLSDPFAPGAFRFNAEECVEATHWLGDAQTGPRARQPAGGRPRSRSVVTSGAPIRRAPTADPRTARRSSVVVTHAAVDPPPAAPTDDH